jgi:4-coumarate--CoA ligase
MGRITLVQGYLNNPTATNDCITPDRWFKTGDIAIRDSEGYYYIVDRRKELIKYKVGDYTALRSISITQSRSIGFPRYVQRLRVFTVSSTYPYWIYLVPPAELESVLLTHPEVADAAVIGVDSAKQATELPR